MSHFLVHANFDSMVFNNLNFFLKKKSISKIFFPKYQISPKKLLHKNAIKKVRGVIFQNCVSYQWGFFWKNVGIFEKFWWGSKMGIFGDGVGIFTQKYLATQVVLLKLFWALCFRSKSKKSNFAVWTLVWPLEAFWWRKRWRSAYLSYTYIVD